MAPLIHAINAPVTVLLYAALLAGVHYSKPRLYASQFVNHVKILFSVLWP